MRILKISIFVLAIFVFWSILSGSGTMINNGDYTRVLRCSGIILINDINNDQYQFKFSDMELLPCALVTPMLVIVFFVKLLLNLFFQNEMHIVHVSTTISIIWLTGIFYLIKHQEFEKNIVQVIFIILITAIFGNYFRSLYEETAILAIVPWFLLGVWRWKSDSSVGLILISTFCLIGAKVQMIATVPLILTIIWGAWRHVRIKNSHYASFRVPVALTMGIICLSALSLTRWEYSGFAEQNRYNRFYGGVGQALQGVADWPVRTFFERRTYANTHHAQLLPLTAAFEPNPARPLLGTHYHPTALDLRRLYYERGDVAGFTEILEPGKLSNFIPWLLMRPQIWPELARAIAVTTVTADYRLRGLTARVQLFGLGLLQDVIRQWMGVFGLATLVLAALIGRSFWLPVLFLITFPLAVWGGDGFFEFERHFAPYWMLLPLVFGMSRSGVETSEGPP